MRLIRIGVQLREIQDPAAGGAVQVGHVDVHLVNLFRGKNLLGRRARRKCREIWRRGYGGLVLPLGVRIGMQIERVGGWRAELSSAAKTRDSFVCRRISAADAYIHSIFAAAVACAHSSAGAGASAPASLAGGYLR